MLEFNTSNMDMIHCQLIKFPVSSRTGRWKYRTEYLNSLPILIYVAIFIVLFLGLVPPVSTKWMPKCSVCKVISDNFIQGLTLTSRSNYGGGDTNWEEKKLGSYAKSEIRMVEVMEHLCKTGGDKDCYYMLEEYEELIEQFWFQEFVKNSNTNLHKWLCIENIKVCCPDNAFGPDCSPCIGGLDRPCTGNGLCDGSGTREGKGTCKCNSGYTEELCDTCADTYYEELKNKTHTICEKCDASCKSDCWEAGPTGCEECKDGYELVDEACTDIDECIVSPETGTTICGEEKSCLNEKGSYTCLEKRPKVKDEIKYEIPHENDESKDMNNENQNDNDDQENSDNDEDTVNASDHRKQEL